jgi:two-component system cell cycle response regulator
MTEHTSSKPAVLVVDDSRLMRVAARKILKDDFDILEAGDGIQAWDSLQANPHIQLIMSDLSMPNLDGLGLLKRIREAEHPALRTLPVIIVTGAEDDDGSKQIALSAGASDFITKPFESVQLLARIKAQAKQQQTQQALQESEASKQQLERHSSVDALTGLANQRHITAHIEESLSYARRHHTELALLLVQVEKFKVMFLRRGKQTAEEVLRRIAQLLTEGRRREDAVARVDLDTFAILLPSASCTGARRVAEQLLNVIRTDGFNIAGEHVPVTVSIAVVSPAITTETEAAGLMEDARRKLKLATQAGGDRVQYDLPASTTAAPAVSLQRSAPQHIPVESAVASVAEVEKALQALSTGRRLELHTVPLVRAVMPLLHAWNRAQDNQHAALLDALEKAIGPASDAAVPQPADAF